MQKQIPTSLLQKDEKEMIQRLSQIVITAISLAVLPVSAHAIQTTQADQPQSSELIGNADGIQKIQETLERLERESDRLQQTLSTSASKLAVPDAAGNGDAAVPFNRMRKASAGQQPLDYRSDASQIYRQIQLIKEIMRTPQPAPELESSPISEMDNVAGTSDDSQPSEQMQDTSALFAPRESPLPSRLPTTATAPSNITPVSLNPVRILPEPIDLFEMGSNLFATTEIASALKAYDSVDTANLNAVDSIWLEYLIACCNRTLNDIDTAESIYRQVSNENAHGELVSLSRWWLNQIGRRKMATETYEDFASEFEMLMERAKNYEPSKSK